MKTQGLWQDITAYRKFLKIDSPQDQIAKIEKVRLDDVLSAAKKYFVNSSINLAVIGNFPDRQRFEKLLKL